jgi:3-methylcrotonyl-CoA carboxylase alpha subunit
MTDLATAPRPIRSVLIANRGEIACRVIRTCRRLGLRTVAVHSDADAGALHVREADQAVRIGPPAAAESYLSIPAILDAARRTGADAIHPGYGFLSENAGFAQACRDAGLVFIGPSPGAIAAMGSKIEAKKIAETAGVPTVPGYLGDDQSLERLTAEAERIGFPVMIKASAGGGGRGMRRVETASAMASALQAAKAEARAAFGDDVVLLEKLIANPRHLEVQLMGDEHGGLVHVFERDCSVQRNNQKVFEEAPAPHLAQEVREKLYERSLRLGRTIGYSCAGTVEFIMEAGGDEPYFLEMNTRLQVEHPVTEAVTGIDLVAWQIRVAAGLPLPARQEDIASGATPSRPASPRSVPTAAISPRPARSRRSARRAAPASTPASVRAPGSACTMTAWWPRSSPRVRIAPSPSPIS